MRAFKPYHSQIRYDKVAERERDTERTRRQVSVVEHAIDPVVNHRRINPRQLSQLWPHFDEAFESSATL